MTQRALSIPPRPVDPKWLWTPPDASRSVHVIGDIHVEVSISASQQHVVDDLAAMTAIKRVQIGDLADNPTFDNFAATDALAKAYLAKFDMPIEVALGNHDIFHSGRTPAAWEAAWSTSRNRVVDAGPFLLIFIGPDTMPEPSENIIIPTVTVNWLDAQLAAATKPCIVFCHSPLANTVLGSHGRGSDTSPGHVTVDFLPGSGGTDTALRTVLGNHTSAFAFVSGHTHSDPQVDRDFVKRQQVGSRFIAAINTSAIAFIYEAPQTADQPIRTILVTVPASGDRVEARVRDHTPQKWVTCSTGLVSTVLM